MVQRYAKAVLQTLRGGSNSLINIPDNTTWNPQQMMRASLPSCLEITAVWLEVYETKDGTSKWKINQLPIVCIALVSQSHINVIELSLPVR
jgi:hypothetical protein